MSDLLKEAIADAKTVRETAIANAKMALEEAFTPHLKSMLSAKLSEDEVEEGFEDEITAEEMDDDEDPEEAMHDKNRREDDDDEIDEMGHEDDEDPEEGMHDKNRREDDDEDMDEGIIEINGVKYAPVVEGEHEDEDEMEEGMHDKPRREDDDEEMDEDIDLEEVIKELETEIAEAEESDEDLTEGEHEDDEDPEEGMRPKREDDDEVDEDIDNLDLESVIKELETEIAEAEESDDDLTEGEHEDDDEKKDESVDEEIVVEEDEEDLEEQSKSSGIGAGDNKVNKASAGDEEDPGKGKEMKESVNAMQKELNEYKEAVTFLREKLHEVNILNAKLLYTNRLFKEYVLSNDQKLKIVETFDRAQTTREIKLVYSTLAESFKNGDIKKNRVQESASQKTGTTKPTKKIITEESEVANRFKKLAGII